MPGLVLVRYGELALKSAPVRREFERTLTRNIIEQFARAGESCRLRNDRGHLYVECARTDRAVVLLRRTFGVTSVSEVTETTSDRDEVRRAALAMADEALPAGTSFAVRARRTGSHPYTSQELAREIGAAILSAWPERGLRVDLEEPSVEVHVEVRDRRTYLYRDRQTGPGGLPLGVAGRVVAWVDGPRGALGAYLMMKRGCRCALAAPDTGNGGDAELLLSFDPRGNVERTVAAPEDRELRLKDLVRTLDADGIVLPLRVEEFPEARERWGETVVFSPTVAFSDEEVDSRWRAVRAIAE